MSDASGLLKLRPDLHSRRIQFGNEYCWVIKDPLARAYFYFSEREFAILGLLDGHRKVAEVAAECQRRFSPDFFPWQALVRFIAEAKRNALIVSEAPVLDPPAENPDAIAKRSVGVQSLLAVRLPGVQPNRLFEGSAKAVRNLMSPALLCSVAVLMVVAALTLIVNFEAFAFDLRTAISRSSHSWLITLLVVVAITKVVHEFAHAIACKAFGAECRELGVMFLVGVPCLYCDVSDAWMIPQRWKRILVSAAGMIAEIVLAACAILLWAISSDPSVQGILVTVIVSCTVSTIVFNANPLMKFDGYFILSDWLGIPNLATEASTLVRRRLRGWLWGIADHRADTEPKRTRILLVFGLLSGLYRASVYITIGYLLYSFLESKGLAAIGVFALLFFLGGLLWGSIRSVIRPPSVAESRMTVKQNAMLKKIIVVAVVFGVLLVPLPRRVVAPALVRPADSQDVFVLHQGDLVSALKVGADVTAGDVIAKIRNRQTEIQAAQLETRFNSLAVKLKGLQQRRSTNSTDATQIPAVQKSLEAAEKQLDFWKGEIEQLTIRAPKSGRVFTVTAGFDKAEVRRKNVWQEQPFGEHSVGSKVERGMQMCTIGHPEKRQAIVMVTQQDVSELRVGQHVDVAMPALRYGSYSGTVVEILAAPIDQLDPLFAAAGLVETDPMDNRRPREVRYQVIVDIETNGRPLNVMSIAMTHIRVESRSLLWRMSRAISNAFGSAL